MARFVFQILLFQSVCALLLLKNCSAWTVDAGSRKLLQPSASSLDVVPASFSIEFVSNSGLYRFTYKASCKYDFSKVDFSSVTSVCKSPDYLVSECCPPFSALACQYKPAINDFSSLCPLYFLSYLNAAGNYRDGVFVGAGRCNNGNSIC